MHEHQSWGLYTGWAQSPQDILSRSNTRITPDLVEGFFRQYWKGAYNIMADYAPNSGFNVASTTALDINVGDVTITYVNYLKMVSLLESGLGQTSRSGWEKANLLGGAAMTSIGFQTEMMNYAIRSSFKTARTYSEFKKLQPSQQAWRNSAILGKDGLKVMKTLKGANALLAISTSAYSAFDAISYYSNNGTDWQVGTKAALDVIMTGVGFLGPIGFGISATYFILNATTNNFGGFGDH